MKKEETKTIEKKELEKIRIDEHCHDCHVKMKFKRTGMIANGKLLKYQHNGDYIFVYKCDQCYTENPSLTKFQRNEVYTRVVGYLRPVQQFNEGKKLEYKQRKTYDTNKKTKSGVRSKS